MEYEKSKQYCSIILSNNKRYSENKRLNELFMFLNNNFNNKIHEKIFEQIFFRNFIGNLNMNKILTELMVNH